MMMRPSWERMSESCAWTEGRSEAASRGFLCAKRIIAGEDNQRWKYFFGGFLEMEDPHGSPKLRLSILKGSNWDDLGVSIRMEI